MTKVAFFGSSEYSLIILQKLLTLPDFQIGLVITKIDKAVGRDQKITPNPVAKFAADHHLPLLQIEEFSPSVKLEIGNLKLDIGLCVAFGPPFFDQKMIDLFPQKIINIHPSPLPKYRGATPGPWQIINGETTSAVTFFEIDLLPDHGPIIAQIPFEISPTDTADSFYQKAFTLASSNLCSILTSYIVNHISLHPQDHTQKSYYPKFTKDSAQIDWSWPVNKIARFVRALNPWPVAWTYIINKQGQKFKIKVISADIISGKLQFKNVHIEGKKPTLWSEIEKHYSLVLEK